MIRTFNLPDHEIEEGPLDGGMAHVYIARHTVLGRRVAIKVVRPEFVADSGFASRFVREAKIVSRLNHPNVVTLYQVGERQGKPYFVMEYLAGGELKQRIHNSATVGKTGEAFAASYACQLTLAEVLRIAVDVAGALAAAHAKGYVHRDIKPSNIMFRADNSVVVTDFGIAKATEPEKTQVDMTVTHGAVIGTPLYMSPEQVDPSQVGVEQLDGRADIYSLGAVLYYALTGHPPFMAETPFQLGLKHLTAPIPKLPPYLKYYQPLLQRCMAKRPADRFDSADAFAAEVTRLLQGHPRSAIPLDESLPRFELPWQRDDGMTGKLFESVSDWFSPARAIMATLVIVLLGAMFIGLANRTRTEDLLSVVATQQNAIDALLAAPSLDFDKAFEKVEYTLNLLKIQPDNPTSKQQLAALEKKVEGGVYEEIAVFQFDSARKHMEKIDRLFADGSAKKDIQSALSDSEIKWNTLQEEGKREQLRAELVKKIDLALEKHELEHYVVLLEEAKKVNVPTELLTQRQLRLEQIKADDLVQQEKLKQERLQVLRQQFDDAKQRNDLVAVDSALQSMRAAGVTDDELQALQTVRQRFANDLTVIAKIHAHEKEQARFSELETEQADGNLERQFSVWQTLNAQPFLIVPATSVVALKQRVEQRVTQMIRAELKSGHNDVAEIWRNDAKVRGLNLPWAQLELAAKPNVTVEPDVIKPEPVVVEKVEDKPAVSGSISAAITVPSTIPQQPSVNPVGQPELNNSAVSNSSAEKVTVAHADKPDKSFVQKGEDLLLRPFTSDKAAPALGEKSVEQKPKAQPREVQVIGF